MPMYFVQHGIALDKAINPDRPLSEAGVLYTGKMARFLADSDIQIIQILHSGKERAKQTAMLFSSALNISTVQSQSYLNPNDDVNQIIPLLKEDCMYIGHLPHMGKLVSKLLCGNDNSSIVQFENAAVVCIVQEGKHFSLKWMIRPSMLQF